MKYTFKGSIHLLYVPMSIFIAAVILSYVAWGESAGSSSSSHYGSATAGDPTLHPISMIDLSRLIATSDLSAGSNWDVLERAANLHLLQPAYQAYSGRYDHNPDGFYENLWKGEAAHQLANQIRPDVMGSAPLYDTAEECLGNAVKLNPHSALAKAFYGKTLFDDGNAKIESPEAVAMIRSAIKNDPQCLQAHLAMAHVYSDFTSCPWVNPAKGVREYEFAMKLNPSSSAIRLGLLKDAAFMFDRKAVTSAAIGAFGLVRGDVKLTKEVSDDLLWAKDFETLHIRTAYSVNDPDPIIPTKEQEAQSIDEQAAKMIAQQRKQKKLRDIAGSKAIH